MLGLPIRTAGWRLGPASIKGGAGAGMVPGKLSASFHMSAVSGSTQGLYGSTATTCTLHKLWRDTGNIPPRESMNMVVSDLFMPGTVWCGSALVLAHRIKPPG